VYLAFVVSIVVLATCVAVGIGFYLLNKLNRP
jgi:hypothetical protein